MKNNKLRLTLSLKQWDALPLATRLFIRLYRQHTGLQSHFLPDLSELLFIHNLVNRSRHIDILPRDELEEHKYFDNAILGDEFAMFWDGPELLDVVLYEISQGVRRLLANKRTV